MTQVFADGPVVFGELEQPSDESLLDRKLEFRIADIHTATPGIVHQYNPLRNTVDVQPALKRVIVNADGTTGTMSAPMLVEVPVLFPRGGGYAITWPLQPGDVVLLVFCERSIDTWSITGGEVRPEPARKHDWSDAVAIPGTAPVEQAIDVNDTDLSIGLENRQSEIRIHGDGTVTVNAPQVILGGGDGPQAVRVGDLAEITPESDPEFFAWLRGGAGPQVVPFAGDVIHARISTGSAKVRIA